MREMKDISLKSWSGCRKNINVKEWSRVRLLQRTAWCSSKIIACPGDTRTATQSSYLCYRGGAEAWSDFRNFRIRLMNFGSEVSSCASRPIEAMIWIHEFESAQSITDLKTPKPSCRQTWVFRYLEQKKS